MIEQIASNQENGFGPAIKEFELTVPVDYRHENQIDTYAEEMKSLPTTCYFNVGLTSKNFEKATTKLTPGKTYKVKFFPIRKRVTSEDCLDFLREQDGILVGGQGMTLVKDLKEKELPVGRWIASFDEEQALWGGERKDDSRVPCMFQHPLIGCIFSIVPFKGVWYDRFCLMCFCEL